MDVDVCIVGGGPAGAATARALALRGRSVALCFSRDRARPCLGEVLVPAARRVLRALDINLVILAKHPPCFGTVSLWGSDRAYEADLIRDADGHGWRVDRGQFAADLRTAAMDAGALMIQGARLDTATREGSRWRIRLGASFGRELRARWLVDATGRAGKVARLLGAQPQHESPLVALAARVSSDDADTRSFVESGPDGWWYSGRVSDHEHVAVFFTAPDYAARHRLREPAMFAAALAATQLVGTRGAELADAPFVTNAAGRAVQPFDGRGWLAVGDAALAFDPLSSQGLLAALYGGMVAGEAISRDLDEDAAATLNYVLQIQALAAAYARQRAYFYALEKRWADRPFWQLQQAPANAPPAVQL